MFIIQHYTKFHISKYSGSWTHNRQTIKSQLYFQMSKTCHRVLHSPSACVFMHHKGMSHPHIAVVHSVSLSDWKIKHISLSCSTFDTQSATKFIYKEVTHIMKIYYNTKIKIINEGTAPMLVLYTADNEMCKGTVTFTGMVFINQNLNFIKGTDINT